MSQQDAAKQIADILRACNNLESLQKTIGEAQRSIQQLQIKKQQMEQQLSMLNTSTVKYQSAIRSLADLQAAGFSSSQIAELTGLVSMWNKLPGNAGGLNVFE
jgi:predicted  nucleic acid-binding Zn-ribbon protein